MHGRCKQRGLPCCVLHRQDSTSTVAVLSDFFLSTPSIMPTTNTTTFKTHQHRHPPPLPTSPPFTGDMLRRSVCLLEWRKGLSKHAVDVVEGHLEERPEDRAWIERDLGLQWTGVLMRRSLNSHTDTEARREALRTFANASNNTQFSTAMSFLEDEEIEVNQRLMDPALQQKLQQTFMNWESYCKSYDGGGSPTRL